ncbi:hypothetical protein Trydic_g22274 [Trypoxylus dichotomus]
MLKITFQPLREVSMAPSTATHNCIKRQREYGNVRSCRDERGSRFIPLRRTAAAQTLNKTAFNIASKADCLSRRSLTTALYRNYCSRTNTDRRIYFLDPDTKKQ